MGFTMTIGSARDGMVKCNRGQARRLKRALKRRMLPRVSAFRWFCCAKGYDPARIRLYDRGGLRALGTEAGRRPDAVLAWPLNGEPQFPVHLGRPPRRRGYPLRRCVGRAIHSPIGRSSLIASATARAGWLLRLGSTDQSVDVAVPPQPAIKMLRMR
jgi:hypothetical protein